MGPVREEMAATLTCLAVTPGDPVPSPAAQCSDDGGDVLWLLLDAPAGASATAKTKPVVANAASEAATTRPCPMRHSPILPLLPRFPGFASRRCPAYSAD